MVPRHFSISRRDMSVIALTALGATLFETQRSVSDSPMTPLLPGSVRSADNAQSNAWKGSLHMVRQDGVPFQLRSLPGRVVIVALWGAFCVPCREELSSLMRLQTQFGPGKVGLAVVGYPQFWSEDYPAAVKCGAGANICTLAPATSNDALETAFALDGVSLEVPQALVFARSDSPSGLALIYRKKGITTWASGRVFDEIRHQATAAPTPVMS
jgi:thiol-disulfide isomerase/thioredoxin